MSSTYGYVDHRAKQAELISRTYAHALYLETSGGGGDGYDAKQEPPE